MNIDKLLQDAMHAGIALWLEGDTLCYRANPGALTPEFKSTLQTHKTAIIRTLRQQTDTIHPDPAQRYAPFPLTDIQTAYLLGRQDFYLAGKTGCHGYVEFTLPERDPQRLEQAWHAVIQRHDMLRAIIDPAGFQQVLRDITLPPLLCHDLRFVSAVECEQRLADIRQQLSHRVYQTNSWPLYELQLSQLPDGCRLHVSIDLLIADFASIHVLFSELDCLYHSLHDPLPPLHISFRDVVLSERARRDRPDAVARYQRDRQYWLARIETLPDAPELPLAPGGGQSDVRFTRHSFSLSPEEWQTLKRKAAEKQLTPTAMLLGVYTSVVGYWSRHPHFSLIVTRMERPQNHPDIARIVGDFTSMTLLAVNATANRPFTQQAVELQQQLWEDLEHGEFSGIEVLRELRRQRGEHIMPVVFTSLLGVANSLPSMRDGEICWGISQTPQVWLDCQVTEHADMLIVNWDVRDGQFPEQMIEHAQRCFATLLNQLSYDEASWHQALVPSLPQEMTAIRQQRNATEHSYPNGTLLDGFLHQLKTRPADCALVDTQRTWSYQQLADLAGQVQQALDCQPGEIIAIALEKSGFQIAALIGIMASAAVYLPLDLRLPTLRLHQILENARVRCVITNDGIRDWPGQIQVIDMHRLPASTASALTAHDISPSDPAYVIYTSGTTGQPKGVVVSHQAARNTLLDLNQRLAVTPKDRILGLASLSFDLSVYDIFGAFFAGARLILPNSALHASPAHWAELIIKHRVTLWNSVPAQMQMLLAYQNNAGRTSLPLRVALLSGDKILLSLPSEFWAVCPQAQLISLGGATEAAIWSIIYPLSPGTHWTSRIPYGIPLANQKWYVLNADLNPCPDWTAGELFIAGMGLAEGYLYDEERTAQRFFHHPQSGERLYRTGDIGCVRPDGVLEIFGRDDNQIKIRGHRVELGDIETAIASHPAVADAVALCEETGGEKQLAAFYTLKPQQTPNTTIAEFASLKSHCQHGLDEALPADQRCALAAWMAQAGKVALLEMMETFQQHGLFGSEQSHHSLADIRRALQVHDKFYPLLNRWLHALCHEGWLTCDAQQHDYRKRYCPEKMEKEALWKQLEQQPLFGEALLRYLAQSARHLPQLLRGDSDPLALLFPEGSLTIPRYAYQENPVNHTLNQVLANAAVFLAQHIDAPLRVLEIGAGVGGTAHTLVPALRDRLGEYWFTDVSPFFLNQARNTFSEFSYMRYGLYDINQPWQQQSCLAGNYDIIVAANVLHNARNATQVMRQLRSLAAPGGFLLLIEATRDIYTLMISIEFDIYAPMIPTELEDGLSGFNDLRADGQQTFFSVEQWHSLCANVGAEVLHYWPHVDDPLAQCGQSALIVRFPDDRIRLDQTELSAWLQPRLPEWMIPTMMAPIDAIPLSANGKVDRRALGKLIQHRPQATASNDELQGELEQRIGQIWATAIGCPLPGRHSNFFTLGGDSLLVAQVVAQMRQSIDAAANWSWEKLMRAILQTPTIADIASQLALPSIQVAANRPDSASPVLQVLYPAPDSNTVMVFIHDGLGSLAPYQHLIATRQKLAASPQLWLGIAIEDLEQTLAIPADELISQLGIQYSAHIARYIDQHQVRSVSLTGYCMGGLLAHQIACCLLERDYPVAQLNVISSSGFPWQVEEPLLLERAFARLVGADLGVCGHWTLEPLLEKALHHLLKKGQIATGELTTLQGEFTSLAQHYQQLSLIAPHERLSRIASALPGNMQIGALDGLFRLFHHVLQAIHHYQPLPYSGTLRLLRDEETLHFLPGLKICQQTYWSTLALGYFICHDITGDHLSCMESASATQWVSCLLSGGVE